VDPEHVVVLGGQDRPGELLLEELVDDVVGAVGVGVLILIGIVIKDRLKKAKTDRFKEVER